MPKPEYIAASSLQAAVCREMLVRSYCAIESVEGFFSLDIHTELHAKYVDDFECPNHPLPRTRTAQNPSTAVRLPQLVPTVGFRAAGVRILADVPPQWSGSAKSLVFEELAGS
ncbi:hypothetical protein GX48_01161 [Paracoccidioides brasiliensis]|nr:hypothetical protein GX48_01161 [Paracoccidioides brasiliensis]